MTIHQCICSRYRSTLATLVVVLFVALTTLTTPSAIAQVSIRENLATAYARKANELLASPTPTTPAINLALELVQIAIELNPTDVKLREQLLDIAELAERSELAQNTIADLAQLAPDNQAITLKRLNQALGRFQTAQQRINAYTRLLTEENINRLNPAIASRLMYDLSDMYRRIGDVAKQGEWLARATSVDPTNELAAGAAAGFYDAREDDPFAMGELLVNYFMANPANITTQVALARHLLENGAYAGAAKMYGLAVESHQPLSRTAASDLIADQALALWGANQPGLAFEAIEERQLLLNSIAQQRAMAENPELGPVERSQIIADLPPTLHAVQLALIDRVGAGSLKDGVSRFVKTIDNLLGELPTDDTSTAVMAERRELHLAKAWIQAWFTSDVDAVKASLDQARAIGDVDDATETRLEGWMALRRRDHTLARDTLTPIADSDAPAAIGLAMVDIAEDKTRDAARHLARAMRMAPGTAVGLWARSMLSKLVNAPVPPDDLGRKLNVVVESIPGMIFSMPTEPSRLVSVSAKPTASSFNAFEPVTLMVRVTNNASFPIGIDTQGPVQKLIILEPRVTIAGNPQITRLPGVAVSLDRRFRLEPYESVEIPVDLRRTRAGQILNEAMLLGASVAVTVTLNPRVNSNGAVEPSLLGSTRRSEIFRVDGIGITPSWVEGALAALATVDEPTDTLRVTMLARALIDHRNTQNQALATALADVPEKIAEAFSALEPIDQAFVLAVLPPNATEIEPIRQLARSSDQSIVQVTFLVSQLGEADDAMIDASLRSDDAQVKRVGTLIDQFRTLRKKAEQLVQQPPVDAENDTSGTESNPAASGDGNTTGGSGPEGTSGDGRFN